MAATKRVLDIERPQAALTGLHAACHKGMQVMSQRAAIIEILRLCLRAGAVSCLVLAAALAVLAAPAAAEDGTAAAAQSSGRAGQADASLGRTVGSASGLPLPRFVSLKSGRINVRRGPGNDYPIEWVFEKRGLPVEVTAESDRWRRIRDREGDVGWVWHSMLDGRRTAIVQDVSGGGMPVALRAEARADAAIVAYAEPGVVAQLAACEARWCALKASGYEGWVERNALWGIYSDETFE